MPNVNTQIVLPEELLPYKAKFERRRKGNGRCKCTKTYEEIHALAADPDLTLEEVGEKCGGRSKQWAAQILDQYFPRVRPENKGRRVARCRREDPETRRQKRLEARRKAREKFEAECINFQLLKEHAKSAGFRLVLVWRKGRPLHRVFRIDGRKCLVIRICSAANLSGTGLYAHCISPTPASLEHVEDIAVLVDVRSEELNVSRLYRISVKKFKAKGQTNILIRLTKRDGNGGGPRAAIQWSRHHLISKLL